MLSNKVSYSNIPSMIDMSRALLSLSIWSQKECYGWNFCLETNLYICLLRLNLTGEFCSNALLFQTVRFANECSLCLINNARNKVKIYGTRLEFSHEKIALMLKPPPLLLPSYLNKNKSDFVYIFCLPFCLKSKTSSILMILKKI